MKPLIALALGLVSVLAACGPDAKGQVRQTLSQCAKATENQLVAQARDAFIQAVTSDPKSVSALLNALALDAAQAGVADAVGFVSCVAEAVKAKLVELASHASLDQETYQTIMDGLNGWEQAHQER